MDRNLFLKSNDKCAESLLFLFGLPFQIGLWALQFHYAFFDRGIIVCQSWKQPESKWLQLYFKWLSDFFFLVLNWRGWIGLWQQPFCILFLFIFCQAERNISELCQSRLPVWHLCPVPRLKKQPSCQVENENVHTPTPRKQTLSARWQVNVKRGKRPSWIW